MSISEKAKTFIFIAGDVLSEAIKAGRNKANDYKMEAILNRLNTRQDFLCPICKNRLRVDIDRDHIYFACDIAHLSDPAKLPCGFSLKQKREPGMKPIDEMVGYVYANMSSVIKGFNEKMGIKSSLEMIQAELRRSLMDEIGNVQDTVLVANVFNKASIINQMLDALKESIKIPSDESEEK